jgi:hypothetical protein
MVVVLMVRIKGRKGCVAALCAGRSRMGRCEVEN